MKVTYDLGKKPSVSAGIHPYVGMVKDPATWAGARAEVTFFTKDPSEDGDPAEINFEADSAEDLRDALLTMVDMLNSLIYIHKEEAADRLKHSVKCGFCECHSDSRRPKEWGHPDGKGHQCLGNGTRVMHRRKVLAYRSGGEPPCWTEVPFESLQPHEKFRVKDPMDNEKGVTFEAVDAPFSHYDGYRATLGVRYILPAPILSLVP